MPLSSSVLVNRDEVLDLIAEMQEALPDEIKQARWIVKDREELLGEGQADGEAHRGAGPRGAAEDGAQGRHRGPCQRGGRTDRGRGRGDLPRHEARGRGVRRRQARAVRDRVAQDPRGIADDVPGAREDPRSGRGRVATSSGRRRPPPSRSSAITKLAHRARPNCSTRRGRDHRADRRARSGRPAGQFPTGARRRHASTSSAPSWPVCARTMRSRVTSCWRAWSRASWSRAPCAARSRCGAPGA